MDTIYKPLYRVFDVYSQDWIYVRATSVEAAVRLAKRRSLGRIGKWKFDSVEKQNSDVTPATWIKLPFSS